MKTIEERANELIEFITLKMKEMGLNAEEVFLNGNCGNLYSIFASYFKKEAVVPYEILYKGYPHHIVTKIGDDYYDITGKTSLDKYIEYVKENNTYPNFRKEDFEIKEIGIPNRNDRIRKQTNRYNYDEDFGQSSIVSEMDRLDVAIKSFENEKESTK